MPYDDELRDHIQRSVSGDAKLPKKVSEKVNESDYEVVTADYKETDNLLEQTRNALEKFGLFMYPLPSVQGSDTYGFIISKRKLSDEEIAEIDEYPEGG